MSGAEVKTKAKLGGGAPPLASAPEGPRHTPPNGGHPRNAPEEKTPIGRDSFNFNNTRIKLVEVAEINPNIDRQLDRDTVVSFVSMSNLSAESASTTTGEDRKYHEVSKGYTPFLNGDILVAKITPCFENGKIGQANLLRPVGFGSTEFHVVRSDSSKLDARYLLHFLRQGHIRLHGERRMTGSAGQKRVPENFLSELEIPLPPLPEQRRIAEVLDMVEAIRGIRNRIIRKLESLSESTFIELFGDPVANPKKWPDSIELGKISDIVSGITKGRMISGKAMRSIPYLAVLNVQDKHLNLEVVKEIAATEEEIERYRLRENDLLLTEGGDPDKLGRGTLWNNEIPECIHQNHIFRVRLLSNEVTPLFLNWLVGSQRGKRYFLSQSKQTTGIASINMGQLRGFPLLIPPLSLQKEFARRIAAIGRIKTAHLDSLAHFDALFASLQHRAFRGEL